MSKNWLLEPIFFTPPDGSSSLWKSAPSAPPAPDYGAAASAQGAANVDTAVAESIVNRPNQVTPYGTLNYNQTGTFNTPGGQAVPQFTSQVDLTPLGQQRFDQEQRINQALGGIAESGVNRVGQSLGSSFDMSGIPPQARASEETRQRVADALYGRVAPQLQRSREQGENALLVGGFNPGGEAWKARQDDMARQENDAMMTAQINAGGEESRQFGLDSAARDKAIQEQAYLRSLPLNEINAIRSGSQVQMPQFAGSGGSSIGAAPIFNAANQGAQYNQGIYNAQTAGANAANSGLYSALGSLGSMGMYMYGGR